MPGDRFYRTPEWRRLRAKVLADRIVCEEPGCGRQATHVDHRVPIRQGGAPLDRGNLRALCRSCHSRLTACHDGGFGHPLHPGKETRTVPGAGLDGAPLDPRHHWNRGTR